MPICDYAIAKSLLTEVEKNRILCMYFSARSLDVDFDKASKDFGTCTKESFQRMVRQTLSKIEDAGGRLDVANATSGILAAGKRKTKGAGRKPKRARRVKELTPTSESGTEVEEEE